MMSQSRTAAVDHQFLSRLFDRLFPICRSITGRGLRESLAIFAESMPLTIEQVASGSRVFDWTVPPEWNIKGARLLGPKGETVVDFAHNNLHVVNYSERQDRRLTLAELQSHLHSLPDLPQAVPYVTSYYKRTWGFCLSDQQRQSLPEGEYHAIIDSEFSLDGGVDYGWCLLPGDSDREVLVSSYLCHPSLANNELSGPLVLLGLYDRISRWPKRRLSYRFVLNPETIGALCFLHNWHEHLRDNLDAGLVLTCMGGPSQRLSYKTSRGGDEVVDQAIEHFRETGGEVEVRPFTPVNGSDERQYCAPGFNLPIGQIARTVYGDYDGYHNSRDDKQFMGIDPLLQSIDEVEQILQIVDAAGRYQNLKPFGEPQLGKYDLYPSVNSAHTWKKSNDQINDQRSFLERVLMLLNHCDGDTNLFQVAERSGYNVFQLSEVVDVLEEKQLLKRVA